MAILLFNTSCDLDNFDEPTAQVFGAIIDVKTGELIEQEIGTSGDAAKIKVIESGWPATQEETWKIKLNGEFRNDLVFAGTYNILLTNGNFEKQDTIYGYKIHPGINELNFKVIPYIRILNPSITRENNKIIARFSLEYASQTGMVEKVALFFQSDQHPCHSFFLGHQEINLVTDDIEYSTNAATSSKIYTIILDLNSDEGKKITAGRPYFFRIGAAPRNLPNGIEPKYNYSSVVKIQF